MIAIEDAVLTWGYELEVLEELQSLLRNITIQVVFQELVLEGEFFASL
jgi:hypothetical protein